MGYSVEEFVSDVGMALPDGEVGAESVWALGALLQRLVAEGGDLTVQGEGNTGSSGLAGSVLHVDPEGRFRLIVARFAAGEPTPVHSHARWGVECGISGRERFTVWHRVDDGGAAGVAELRVLSDHHIEHGDLGHWYEAPRNIHRQWAEGSEPSCVAILMGGDGRRLHHFDLVAGTYSDA